MKLYFDDVYIKDCSQEIDYLKYLYEKENPRDDNLFKKEDNPNPLYIEIPIGENLVKYL